MVVDLQKGQEISLKKEDGGELSKISMGLGWDVAESQESGGFLGNIFGGSSKINSIDLDASCVVFDHNKKPVDAVFFDQLKSKDGSIIHMGDNKTGKGDGDDEAINVDLSRVPFYAKSLVFTVNIFTEQTFESVSNAYCRIVDADNDNEIARYNLSSQGSHNAMIMVKLERDEGEWKMCAIGETATGKIFQDLMTAMIPHA